jgi:phosphohistidine phosphatase
MRLYLVRHGDAVSSEVDPRRPLSRAGRAAVKDVADFLERAGARPARVLHSGKARAEETARLLADALGAAAQVEASAGLEPLDPTAALVQRVAGAAEDTMVVGHLPFLDRLVSRLVAGDEDAATVSFGPATVVCLEREQAGEWSIAWVLPAELAAGAGGAS